MATMTKDERLGEIDRIAAELASIRKALRRGAWRKTLAEEVEWEREFGPELPPWPPRQLVERYKHFAREYDVPYATVKAAFAEVEAQAVIRQLCGLPVMEIPLDDD